MEERWKTGRTEDGRMLLCGANSYEQKYYFNPDFNKLPQSVQDELHILCVLYTEAVSYTHLDVYKRQVVEACCRMADRYYGAQLRICLLYTSRPTAVLCTRSR